MKNWVVGKLKGRSIGEFVEECRWTADYVVRFKGTVFVHVLLGVLSIVLTLLSSVASKVLVDAIIGFDTGVIGFAVCLMIGARLASIFFKSVSMRIAANLDVRVQNEIQREVFQRILKTDWQSLEEYRDGDLLSRVDSDVRVISGAVTGLFPSLITCTVQLFGSFVLIFMSDAVLALIALCGVPLTMCCSGMFLRRLRTYHRELKEVGSDVLAFQQDSFQNMTMIKSFGLSDFYGLQMDRMHDQVRSTYLKYNRFSVWTSAWMNVLSVLTSMSCFLWALYCLWQGKMTFGDITLFLQLAGMLAGSFSTLVSFVPSLISITTSARRILQLVHLPEEKVEKLEGLDELEDFQICLENVSFGYKGGSAVLENCDFVAGDGDLVAIVGPSGEGKTTLLRMMLGLVSSTSGSASLIVGDRTTPLSASTRCLFGYVPQENRMVYGTIRENLMLANPDAKEEELMEALRLACADEFVLAFEDGLDHVVGGRDKRLSEGQAQRLAVARALLKKAPILLLDEATSALDQETEEKMVRQIMQSGAVRTCIFVTHRPFAKSLCTKMVQLHEGVLKEVSCE